VSTGGRVLRYADRRRPRGPDIHRQPFGSRHEVERERRGSARLVEQAGERVVERRFPSGSTRKIGTAR
jgi:hypothetical protein